MTNRLEKAILQSQMSQSRVVSFSYSGQVRLLKRWEGSFDFFQISVQDKSKKKLALVAR
jgi:hypothetical protein